MRIYLLPEPPLVDAPKVFYQRGYAMRNLLLLFLFLGSGFLISKENDATLSVAPVSTRKMVKAPELPETATGNSARPLWMIKTPKDFSGSVPGWKYTALDENGKRLAELNSAIALSWSPDGSRYAFIAARDFDKYQICIKPLNGAQKAVELKSSKEVPTRLIAWSPNGKYLAFLMYSTYASEVQFVAQPNGINMPVHSDNSPSMNPEEYSLIILETDFDQSHNPFVAQYRISQQTWTGIKQNMSAMPDKLRWSPDGQKLLVSWMNVVTVDVSSGTITVIYPHNAAAAWAPNGEGIYYLAVDTNDIGNAPAYMPRLRKWTGINLYRFSDAKTFRIATVENLAALGLLWTTASPGFLDFSPDGSAVALAAGELKGNGAVHLFPFKNGPLLLLEKPLNRVVVKGAVLALDWSPDGQKVAVITAKPHGDASKTPLWDIHKLDLTAIIVQKSKERNTTFINIAQNATYSTFMAGLSDRRWLHTKLLSWSH
jgi:hypothetical protein